MKLQIAWVKVGNWQAELVLIPHKQSLFFFLFQYQGSHSLEMCLNFRGSHGKVLEFNCCLKSPWIFFNFECSVQGSHSLEKSLNFRVNPWKVLEFLDKVLKSPWIFANIDSEEYQESCIVKIRVFFRFNFVKKKNAKNYVKFKAKPNTTQNVSRDQIDQRLCIWVVMLLRMPHGADLRLRSWNIALSLVSLQNPWKVQF